MIDIFVITFKKDNYPLGVVWTEAETEGAIESMIGAYHGEAEKEDFDVHRMLLPDIHYTVLRKLMQKGIYPADSLTSWCERELSPGTGGQLILQSILGTQPGDDPLQDMFYQLENYDDPLDGLGIPYKKSEVVMLESKVDDLIESFKQ